VITARSLRLLQQLRKTIGGHADDAVRAMTASWLHSWRTLAGEWVTALDQIADQVERTGRWPTAYDLNRLDRLARATARTRAALDALSAQAGATAGTGAAQIVTATAAAEPGMVAAQLPAAIAADGLRAYVKRIVPTALESITVRCQQQIYQRLWPLSADAVDAMRRRLVVGIAVGDNPRVAARAMVRDVEGAFNGGLSRAMTLARTEMLDAYRDTSAYTHQANRDVVDSWVWIAALGPRCCPGCWAMHGTEWPVDQPGPWDHQQGRCARMPKVKPWRELGYDVDEPAGSLVPDAKARYAALTPGQRLTIMGPRRAALLDSGVINLADLAVKRDTAAWRPSYVPMPVRDLEKIAARRRPQP
jgi:hypothetical protein